MEKTPDRIVAFVERHQVLKILLYYVALGVLVALLWYTNPNMGVFSTAIPVDAELSKKALTEALSNATALPPLQVVIETVTMMLGSVLLMVPVAWVMILTRSRKGFSQSTVQTLIFLPLVVSGVLSLVQHSLAVAFGLGGVVGAVSFRNRLDDPKDAIYIFVAIAVGVGAGVQVLSVAAAISIFFNIVVLIAWRFDFGRMPATLEAGIAKQRVQRVKADSKGSEDFLQGLDKQIFKSMTSDQLAAIAERARERSRGMAGESSDSDLDEEKKAKFDSVLRVTMQPDDAMAVRAAIEQVMTGQTKRFEFEKAGAGEGGRATAQYKVKFKKSIPSTLVVESMRRIVLPKVVTIDVRDA